MQDFDFTKHECSKLVIAQDEIKGLFVLMLGLDGSITAGLVVSEQAEVQELCPTNESVNLNK